MTTSQPSWDPHVPHARAVMDPFVQDRLREEHIVALIALWDCWQERRSQEPDEPTVRRMDNLAAVVDRTKLAVENARREAHEALLRERAGF